MKRLSRRHPLGVSQWKKKNMTLTEASPNSKSLTNAVMVPEAGITAVH